MHGRKNGGGWEAFAKGRRLDGTSMLVDYYHEGTSGGYDATSDRALNDYPVRDFCPMQNAALPGFLSLYSLWDWDYTNPQYFGLSKPGLTRIMNPTWIDTEQKSYEPGRPAGMVTSARGCAKATTRCSTRKQRGAPARCGS
ncbi:MAG: hypothetical protein HND48_14055 [Chloroflexi bacterium]|nr:hypothetical protein [Chloroflexota bacterium]